ncbi:MAG: DUF1583 domain-containing protein [Pirellulaceae bacterium]
MTHMYLKSVPIALIFGCHWAFNLSAQIQEEQPDAPNVTTSASTESFADQIVPKLRDRDLQQAMIVFDALIDQSLTMKELTSSDLPSAAAALYRSLAQQSSGEIFELLSEWTLPTNDRDRVRMLSVPVPTSAPPKVFARSIGERPRDTTFAVASIGPVPGLFCSGWIFLQAANDLGQLPSLRSKLKDLTDREVAGAEPLYALSQLLGARGDLDQANEYLRRESRSGGDGAMELAPNDINVAAVAAAAISHSETQEAAEACLASLVDRAISEQSIDLRPSLRIAHAVAVQAYRGESSPSILFENRLKYWVPTTIRSAKAIQRGRPSGIWLTHEQHLLHLAGGTADILFCRFPLTGSFDFICETQEGGMVGTDGGLAYGGLQFQALGRTNQLTVWDADALQSFVRPSPFARSGTDPEFNHVSIRSSETESQFESNFHPIWFDDATVLASPWLGVRSSGTKRPVFRNLRFVGQPRTVKQIDLLAGTQLRGWMGSFYGESIPPFHDLRMQADDQAGAAGDGVYDWSLQSQTLIGAEQTTTTNARQPGLLQYQRPLLDKESIAYEFMHRDEAAIVHPAIGRLAFLLEPGGVRLRWITTGPSDWSGLEMDNAALEPLYRRGPRPLPVKEGEWNQVRVKVENGDVLVHLNDELVYRRPLESQADTTFGLYRASRASGAKVRNILMTGDWPEQIPQAFLDDPLALASESKP